MCIINKKSMGYQNNRVYIVAFLERHGGVATSLFCRICRKKLFPLDNFIFIIYNMYCKNCDEESSRAKGVQRVGGGVSRPWSSDV